MATIQRLVVLLLLGNVLSFGASTNDFFASRTILVGPSPFASASFQGATAERGEPHAFPASLWWEWIAPTNSSYSFQAFGSTVPPAALVYTGEWPRLTLVSNPRPNVPYATPTSVSFRAEAGGTYYFAAAGYTNNTAGIVSVRIRLGPANDDFSNALPATGTNVFSAVSMQGSTREPGEPVTNPDTVGTVWWKWRPEASGRFAIQASTFGLGVNLVVYRGDVFTNLTPVASATHDWAIPGSRVILDLEEDTYYIAVEDLGTQATDVHLSIRSTPVNDDFENRLTLPSEASVQISTAFREATIELGEPGNTNNSLWWQWTAPVTGSFAVDALSSVFNPAVEIYKGNSLTSLTQVNPPLAGLYSPRAHFRAEDGQTYLIRVSAHYAANGAFFLRIRPGPANDDFANAIVLQGTQFSTNGSFAGATFEPGEDFPISSFGGSVWWTFIPSVSGSYFIEARSQQAQLAVRAYHGNSISNLSALPFGFSDSHFYTARITVRATAGEQIHIQVADVQFSGAPITLLVEPGPINDDFQNALLVTNAVTRGTTRGATSETGEVRGQTVWYRWQPEVTSGYDFQLWTHQGHTSALYVFQGDTLPDLTVLARIQHPPVEDSSATVFAVASETYYIAVNGHSPFNETFEFRIIPGPANDAFAGRTVIQKIDEQILFTTVGATREPGEPSHNSSLAPRTLWFERTADFTGTYYIELWSAYPTPEIAVYQGEMISALTRVPSSTSLRNTANSYWRVVSFQVVEGEKYVIAVADSLARTLSFRMDEGLSHDAFERALPVTLGEWVTAQVVGATIQPGEPAHRTAGPTIWHRFSASTNGSYVALVSDGVPTVYTGSSLTNLVLAGHIFPYLPFNGFPFYAMEGEDYFVAVTVSTPVTYGLRIVPGALNDNFAQRVPIFSGAITNTQWATLEPGEPAHSTNISAGSLWWRWTPTNSGPYRIQSAQGLQDSYLGVYTGADRTNLTIVANRDFPGYDLPYVEFLAEAGVEYSVALGHSPSFDQPLLLEVHQPPAHDNFSTPLILELGQTVTNSVATATLEPGETWSTNATIWYAWTAPSSGTFLFEAEGAGGSDLGVFTGDELTHLHTIAAFTDYYAPTAIAFRAIEGTTYRFSVGLPPVSFTRTIGAVVLPGNPNDDLAQAAHLSGWFAGWTNTTVGATAEPGEEPLAENYHFASVWARWTAPESGQFRVLPEPLNLVNVSVFRGDSFASLEEVSEPIPYGASFFAEAGTTYLLRAGSPPASMSPFRIRLGLVVPNELPQSAAELTGTNIAVEGQNWVSLPGSEFGPRTPVWYRWTAPAHGYLSYIASTNDLFSRVHVSHLKRPTYSSNIVSELRQTNYRNKSGKMAVTEGVTYLFGIYSYPATNIALELNFEPEAVSLGAFSEALFGGDVLGYLQSTIYFSAPDALQLGPLARDEQAWFEMVLPGPGTLRYRVALSGYITVTTTSTRWLGSRIFYGNQNWTQQSIPLSNGTNVIRWTVRQSAFAIPVTGTAWFDDFEVVPPPPRSPELVMLPAGDNSLRLNLYLEPNRSTIIEHSTNLVDWIAWTNLLSPTTALRSLQIPTATNESTGFYRAVVEP